MIRHIVTRGFGNGVFQGSISSIVTGGYSIGAAVDIPEQILFADWRLWLPAMLNESVQRPSLANEAISVEAE